MKQIFLVEDDSSLINRLSFAIKKQGYDIDIARTVLEADKMWEDGKYDLVILDVSLPDGSGFDLCKKILQTSKVPIMFQTAMDEETDIMHYFDRSASVAGKKDIILSANYAPCKDERMMICIKAVNCQRFLVIVNIYF